MVAERKVIDVTELAEPGRLARELGEHPEGLVVGEHGRVIGTIVPEHDLDRKREREREFERRPEPERRRERDLEIDRRLAAIPIYGVDGTPLPDRRMTPKQVQDLLDAIGSMRQIDTEEMHRIVDEGRQLSIQMHAEEERAHDGQ
jgi:hypothetical protein